MSREHLAEVVPGAERGQGAARGLRPAAHRHLDAARGHERTSCRPRPLAHDRAADRIRHADRLGGEPLQLFRRERLQELDAGQHAGDPADLLGARVAGDPDRVAPRTRRCWGTAGSIPWRRNACQQRGEHLSLEIVDPRVVVQVVHDLVDDRRALEPSDPSLGPRVAQDSRHVERSASTSTSARARAAPRTGH